MKNIISTALSLMLFIIFLSCEGERINATKINRQDLKKLIGKWHSVRIEPDEHFAKNSEFVPEEFTLIFSDCEAKRSVGCKVNVTVDNETSFDSKFSFGIYGVSERSSINFQPDQEKLNLNEMSKSFKIISGHVLLIEELSRDKAIFTLSGEEFGVYHIHMNKED